MHENAQSKGFKNYFDYLEYENAQIELKKLHEKARNKGFRNHFHYLERQKAENEELEELHKNAQSKGFRNYFHYLEHENERIHRNDATQARKNLLDKYQISCQKDFRKWALRHHPNKGGNSQVFTNVSALVRMAQY